MRKTDKTKKMVPITTNIPKVVFKEVMEVAKEFDPARPNPAGTIRVILQDWYAKRKTA